MDTLIGIAGYGTFGFICFFLLPLWVYFEKEEKVLALVLFCFALFFVYLIYSYMTDPQMSGDHGAVIVGFLFFIPPFAFVCQLLVYIGYKLVSVVRRKMREKRLN